MFRVTTTADFRKDLDRATDRSLPTPNWDAILAVCDSLRENDIALNPAMNAIKMKLHDYRTQTSLHALQLLDVIVRNCGTSVHDEVINMAFMAELRELIKRRGGEIRNRVLEVLQCWAHGFREKPRYRCVVDTVMLLQSERCRFPEMKDSDALFLVRSVPEWAEGAECHRCRVGFSLTVCKRNCRRCGQIFCWRCSWKRARIPELGIEIEVRVCLRCYDSLNGPKAVTNGYDGSDQRAEMLPSTLLREDQVHPTRTKAEVDEEEELMLALAISLSVAEEATAKPVQKECESAFDRHSSLRADHAPSNVEAALSDACASRSPSISSTSREAKPTDYDLLLKEIERLKKERACKVCLDAESEIGFQPCGHCVTCFRCSGFLNACPVCRAPVVKKERIYLS